MKTENDCLKTADDIYVVSEGFIIFNQFSLKKQMDRYELRTARLTDTRSNWIAIFAGVH